MSATLRATFVFGNLTKAQLKTFEGSDDAASNLFDRLQQLARESQTVSGVKTTCLLAAMENGTQATATVTCVTVANNSTVTIGNVVLTGKTSSPSGQAQFLCGVSATADAAALVAIINAHTTLSTWVSAGSVAGVVTLTALDYDTRANAYALTSSDGTNLAVVGFSGGVLDSKSVTYNVG